jgi:DNA-binding NarL/FixJ family response regulator
MDVLKFIVVDDHEAVLEGTCSVLQGQYPESKILTARAADQVEPLVQDVKPDLVVMDLSIPAKFGEQPQTEMGLQVLRSQLTDHPTLNVVVQSANVRPLIRLKPMIDMHQGGFTIADKSLPIAEMLIKVDWALKGLLYTPPEMRTGLEVKPEWVKVLELAFKESLTDKVIAGRMNMSERAIRHYWTRVQDALGVYPEEGQNIRIQTYNRAREVGLLD